MNIEKIDVGSGVLPDKIAWGLVESIQTAGDKLKQLNIGNYNYLDLL